MPIPLTCPHCGLRCHAPDATAGLKARCPKCLAALDVPAVRATPTPAPPPPQSPALPTQGGQPGRPGFPQRAWLVGAGSVLAIVAAVWAVIAAGRTPSELEAGRRHEAPPSRDERPGAPAPKDDVPPLHAAGETKGDKPRPTTRRMPAGAKELQAPKLGLGPASKLDDFSARMRRWASDTLAFKDARAEVYRSTFDCRAVERFPFIGSAIGRNALVIPGEFAPAAGRTSWRLYLWYRHHQESKAGDAALPRTPTPAGCSPRSTSRRPRRGLGGLRSTRATSAWPFGTDSPAWRRRGGRRTHDGSTGRCPTTWGSGSKCFGPSTQPTGRPQRRRPCLSTETGCPQA